MTNNLHWVLICVEGYTKKGNKNKIKAVMKGNCTT